ncbi:hypothetical protein G9C85_17675 [Halorubellus sp. JP-L1]|uniref:aryl-sulfate sulfotransferase n=1 Tax=Halorubellus sp. JP-L1 TaxID=2715753 RepID=UPI00140D94DA|nr:hypothetical protein [Halorubellus sp. JP-L1]
MNVASALSALRSRRTRVVAYGAVVFVLALALSFQAATAGGTASTTSDDGRWTATPPGDVEATATDPGDGESDGGESSVATRNRSGVLVTVQSYGGFGENNGRAVLVRDGDVVWSFAPEDSRVFDAEFLENGNVLVSYATHLPASECPERTLEHKPDRCVKNNVVELEYDSKDVVWSYRWYDAFINHHEVHDADRLATGETAIADMGNDRAFVVNESGDVVWEWSAREHIGPGSEFWETYGGPDEPRPESDWTHMNDIDRLENGTFGLSIRNFDVLLEVNRSTKDIERVIGEPRNSGKDVAGRDPILDDQHNPMWVADDHVVVADSEADRIVEVDASANEVVWTYDDDLLWPRDADRLPNGNTLVTNSLRYEVVEVTPDGEVVWSYQVAWNGKRGIPYEADRVSLPEEPDGMPAQGATDEPTGSPTGTAAPSGTGEPTATGEPTGSPTATETPTDAATGSGGEGSTPGDADDGDGESGEGDSDENESGDGGLLDRLGGYAFLYLPFWVGTVEMAMLAVIGAVGVAAVVDVLAFAVGRLRTRIAG